MSNVIDIRSRIKPKAAEPAQRTKDYNEIFSVKGAGMATVTPIDEAIRRLQESIKRINALMEELKNVK